MFLLALQFITTVAAHQPSGFALGNSSLILPFAIKIWLKNWSGTSNPAPGTPSGISAS